MSVPYFIKYILDRNTITEYLSQKGYYPDRTGSKSDAYICPFHDDHVPSLSVNEKEIPLNNIMQSILSNVINGFISSLTNVPEERNSINIEIQT